jgi:hypothetical protein
MTMPLVTGLVVLGVPNELAGQKYQVSLEDTEQEPQVSVEGIRCSTRETESMD